MAHCVSLHKYVSPSTFLENFSRLINRHTFQKSEIRDPGSDFFKFYRRHYELISKYNVGLNTLLSEGLSEPEFLGDLVYNFNELKESNDFSFQFRKIITRYRRIGYNLSVMRQSACLVLTQSWLITTLPSLIARRWVGRQTL